MLAVPGKMQQVHVILSAPRGKTFDELIVFVFKDRIGRPIGQKRRRHLLRGTASSTAPGRHQVERRPFVEYTLRRVSPGHESHTEGNTMLLRDVASGRQ